VIHLNFKPNSKGRLSDPGSQWSNKAKTGLS